MRLPGRHVNTKEKRSKDWILQYFEFGRMRRNQKGRLRSSSRDVGGKPGKDIVLCQPSEPSTARGRKEEEHNYLTNFSLSIYLGIGFSRKTFFLPPFQSFPPISPFKVILDITALGS